MIQLMVLCFAKDSLLKSTALTVAYNQTMLLLSIYSHSAENVLTTKMEDMCAPHLYLFSGFCEDSWTMTENFHFQKLRLPKLQDFF